MTKDTVVEWNCPVCKRDNQVEITVDGPFLMLLCSYCDSWIKPQSLTPEEDDRFFTAINIILDGDQ